jgi:hypothetical protein
MPWGFEDTPAGWSANLARRIRGPGGLFRGPVVAPEDSSPNPLTAATYSGWITVTADSGVAVGAPCEAVLTLGSGDTLATVRVTATACGCQDPVGVQAHLDPPTLRLLPVLPNPFQRSATIRFDLPRASAVDLRVFDVAGRLVKTLENSRHEAGAYELQWDGRDAAGSSVAPGVYFVRLNAGETGSTQRVVHWR